MTTGLVNAPVSGLIGLAFKQLAVTNSTPLWEALTNSNQFSAPEMSFWLARDLDPVTNISLSSGGVFTLGGTNSTFFNGDIEYLNLTSVPPDSDLSGFWILSLSSKYSA